MDQADSWIQYIQTAGNAAAFLSISGMGFVADQFGRKRVYLVIMLAMAADSFSIMLAPSLHVLVALHALTSLFGKYLFRDANRILDDR